MQKFKEILAFLTNIKEIISKRNQSIEAISLIKIFSDKDIIQKEENHVEVKKDLEAFAMLLANLPASVYY